MKRYVTWKEVGEYVEALCEKYKDKDIKGVYGIPRGGVCLATMISYKLNIPLLLGPINGCMIVDDICDSGESLLHYAKDTSGNEKRDWIITTMFYKENELCKPDFSFLEKENDWIVFPWEEIYY